MPTNEGSAPIAAPPADVASLPLARIACAADGYVNAIASAIEQIAAPADAGMWLIDFHW